MELTPNLDLNHHEPLYIQLYQYIINEIIEQRINEGEKLPSIRSLAKHLNMSKTTIENAYQQLLAEGYIYSLPHKGYYVSAVDYVYLGKEHKDIKQEDIQERAELFQYKYDFKREYIEEGNFDFNKWKKYLIDIIQYHQEELYNYGDVQGEIALRKEIVKYVHRTRGVIASENQIIIGAGIQSLLNIITDLLKIENIKSLGMEDPGFNSAKSVFYSKDFEVIPITVTEEGIDINNLLKSKLRLCYVSPSHQFPIGSVMRIQKRTEIIKWATLNNGYIIEDDYNSELRYEGKPIPAMKGLDKHDRVIYIGSFSTILIPSIRISFMILPIKLLNLYLQIRNNYTQTASKIEQLAISKMMLDGGFEKHIRRIRKNYAKKRELMTALIRQYLSNYVELNNINAGFNILVTINKPIDEEKLIENIHNADIDVGLISEYSIKKMKNLSLILSYRGINSNKIEEGIKKLANIIKNYNNMDNPYEE